MRNRIPFITLYSKNKGVGHSIYIVGKEGNVISKLNHYPWLVSSYYYLKNPNVVRIEKLQAKMLKMDETSSVYLPSVDSHKIEVVNKKVVPNVARDIIGHNGLTGLFNVTYEVRVAFDIQRESQKNGELYGILGYQTPLSFLTNEEMIKNMEKSIEDIGNIKVMAVDIEVYSKRGGFPTKGDPILSITYSTFRLKDNVFTSDWIKNVKYILNESGDERGSYKIVNEFANIISTEKPDIIVGYNTSGFDFPYMAPFNSRLDFRFDFVIDQKENRYYPHIDLMIVRDMLGSSLGLRSQSVYALDDVSIEALKGNKVSEFYDIDWLFNSEYLEAESKLDHAKLKLYFDNRDSLFFDYIIADVYLTTLLARIWLYPMFLLSILTGIPITVLQRLNMGQMTEYTLSEVLLRLGFTPELRYRNKTFSRITSIKNDEGIEEIKKRVPDWDIFEKGKVYVTKAGVYGGGDKYIVELDFAQLYPTDMVSNTSDPTSLFITKGYRYDGKNIDVIRPTILMGETKLKINELSTWALLKSKGKDGKIHLEVYETIPGYGPISWFIYKMFTARWETKKMKNKAKEQKRVELLAPDQAVKIYNNCYTPDTFVLTTDGVKNIKEIKVGDRVYSVNPDTLEVEIDTVEATWEYDYDGYLFVLNNSKALDLKATPKQHILTTNRNKKKGKFETISDVIKKNEVIIPKPKPLKETDTLEYFCLLPYAQKLEKVSNKEYDAIIHIPIHLKKFKSKLPSYMKNKIEKLGRYNDSKKIYRIDVKHLTCNDIYLLKENNADVFVAKRTNNASYLPAIIKKELLAELSGYYISHGTIHYLRPKIYEKTKRGETMIIAISQYNSLNREKIIETINKVGIKYSKDKRGIYISNPILSYYFISECGKNIKYKHIPDWIFNSSQKVRFAHFYSLTKNKKVYSTTSKKIKDDFLKLVVSLGYFAKVERVGKRFRIYFYDTPTWIKKGTIKTEYYKGKVYDITTKKNHTIFAGRNGKFILTGQSTYGAFSKRRGNLVNELLSASIFWRTEKLLYRIIDVIENDISKEIGADLKVLYGDTDSSYVLLPKSISGELLEEKVNEWIHKHYGPVYKMELEGVYDKMFIPRQKSSDAPSAKSYILLDENGKISKIKGEFFKLTAPLAIKDRLNEFFEGLLSKNITTLSELKMYIKHFMDGEPAYKYFIKKSISSFVDEDDPSRFKNLNKPFHFAGLVSLCEQKAPGTSQIERKKIINLTKYSKKPDTIISTRCRIDPRVIEETQRAVIVYYLPHISRDSRQFSLFVQETENEVIVDEVTIKEYVNNPDERSESERSRIDKDIYIEYLLHRKEIERNAFSNYVLIRIAKDVVSTLYKKLIYPIRNSINQ